MASPSYVPFLLRLGRPGSTDHTTEPLSVSSRGAAFLFPAFPLANRGYKPDLNDGVLINVPLLRMNGSEPVKFYDIFQEDIARTIGHRGEAWKGL